MWGIAKWKKAFVENERTNLSDLSKVGDVVRKLDVVFVGK